MSGERPVIQASDLTGMFCKVRRGEDGHEPFSLKQFVNRAKIYESLYYGYEVRDYSRMTIVIREDYPELSDLYCNPYVLESIHAGIERAECFRSLLYLFASVDGPIVREPTCWAEMDEDYVIVATDALSVGLLTMWHTYRGMRGNYYGEETTIVDIAIHKSWESKIFDSIVQNCRDRGICLEGV